MSLRLRLRSLLRRSEVEEELNEEFQFHLDQQIQQYIARGMTREDARYAALRAIGSVEQRKEECREARGLTLVESVVQDIRYAIRQLRKNPAFAAVVILTLALGIGANTAIFSIVDAVILRPLTYRDADRLFAIYETIPQSGAIPVSGNHFREWRKSVRSFAQMALVSEMVRNLTGAGEAEQVHIGRASAALFPILGIQAQLGRTFLEEEETPGKPLVVVLSNDLWRRRFGSDPGVVGRKVQIDGTSYEVVGVLPAEFRFPKLAHLYSMTFTAARPEVWTPLVLDPRELIPMTQFNFVCIGLLKSGGSVQQAASEINALQAELARQSSVKVDLGSSIVPLQDQMIGRSKTGLELVLAAIGVVLLIACINITNLLLSRTSARRREFGIRSCMGASAGRIRRQMFIESLLLAVVGGIFGVGIANVTIRLILAVAPADVPRLDEVRLNSEALIFALAASLVTGVLVGLLPAWRFSRVNLQEALTSTSRSTTSGRRSGRLRSILVGVEAGLTAVCLFAGGLLLHSFVRLLDVDRGFVADHLVTVDANLGVGSGARYPNDESKTAFIRAVIERVEALPGVKAVAVADKLPLSGEGNNSAIGVEGTDLPLFERPIAGIRNVTTNYFSVLGMSLRSGRLFNESDRGRNVAILSASLAERGWPAVDPVGKRFRIGRDPSRPLVEVIGVVSDVRGIGLDKGPSLNLYGPYWQGFFNNASFVVQTSGEPLAISPDVRKAIREVDPNIALSAFRTMDDVVSDSVAQRRFQMNLILVFAAAAMLLTALGVYGVVSYAVLQRTNEIGVRVALGATYSSVLRMVVFDALRPVVIGLGIGLPLAVTLGFWMRSVLFGVLPHDTATLAAACFAIVLVATLAAYIPARRASRIDPMAALNCE